MTDFDAEALARKHGFVHWAQRIRDDGAEEKASFVDESALRLAREAYAHGLAAAWRDMTSAPRDGTPIVILTRGGSVVRAKWMDHVTEDEDGNPSSTWVADIEFEHPPSWTDGGYWTENEDGEESDPPVAWVPLPPPPVWTQEEIDAANARAERLYKHIQSKEPNQPD